MTLHHFNVIYTKLHQDYLSCVNVIDVTLFNIICVKLCYANIVYVLNVIYLISRL